MDELPASVARRLQALIYGERAGAWLRIDEALVLVAAGGHLDAYGLTALRPGEPVLPQALFLEGLLPPVETEFFLPSVELANGRAGDLHLHLDGDTIWVILLEMTA
jgi:hypothetical protein